VNTGDAAARVTAGLLRRLGAMLYDTLVVVALLALVTMAFLPFTGGEAITQENVGGFEYLYRVVLVLVVVVFFGGFWTRRGQTLGMLAWRLRVERQDGSALRWPDAFKRLAGASISLLALGLGYFWIWIDRDRLAWHDRWSGTRVVVLPKGARA
jgi:uncharacterized RDD family membrane protein YckC